jgi:D-glycero-D-manno-heptose 1,7-bisphosphate phosphatase
VGPREQEEKKRWQVVGGVPGARFFARWGAAGGAPRQTKEMKAAVFLDRDGTLIEESGYLDRLDRLVFFPFTTDAVRLLNRAGFAVVVVTNQSGVARGLLPEAFVHETHRFITDRLAKGGACIDAYYHCPHHPDGIVAEYRERCECRKPQPGLLRRAAADLDLGLERSFVVGDRWQDLDAGKAVGARTVLVRTGVGRLTELAQRDGAKPDATVENLIEAVSWILRQS